MASCMQDHEHHAEGDVWTHTKMVCDALVQLPEWQQLPQEEREVVFAACLLHDIAKPATTKIEGDRIHHPGHSARGAIMIREMFWKQGLSPLFREQVASLVRVHQLPFFLIEAQDPLRKAIQVSLTARCDHLAMVTKADALGRICSDPQRILDNIELFWQFCEEHGCLRTPWPFSNDHSRFEYFRTEGRDPHYSAWDDTRCEMVLMCGLPGAGKDTWIRKNLDLPVISLDAIRDELDAPATGNQGVVVNAGKEQAREYLRKGQSFVWNATNLSRDLRSRLIDLAANYHARIRAVFVDTAYTRLIRQNREREASVPLEVIMGMLRRFEPPTLAEVHQLDWVWNL